jgi:hypothetical protein
MRRTDMRRIEKTSCALKTVRETGEALITAKPSALLGHVLS